MTAPLPVPRVFRFDDVDAFRSSIRNLDVDFTPLARKISAEQVILSLPGCELNYTQSFPRIVDAQLAPHTTAVGFTMDDGVPIRFNGVERDRAVIVLGGGGAFYSSVEETPRQYASVMFTPEIVDRGWPQAGLHFSIHEISQRAQDRLREVVRHILLVTSQPTDDAPFASGESIKETLLAAIDNAFAEIVPAKWTTRANTTRQFKVFNDARAILAGDVAHPIYSGELARQIGVSVRTLHDAIQRYRGVSLHRYLRLRRLWLVRQQLLAGAPSVKTCALAYGFWHLSDFSRSYRSQFGEAPSETLAASRRPGATRADPSRRHGS
ncbi:AraC family transcriptional regulator [Bradyrhizobium brasilense]|uniref:AraC family transcriptional regulator, ethanolamine operon transcriptional activator n=1 Tax=Bradyrhizobium brasilense TaxID=1419277 RepID=A0A1G7DNJ8_9BRAD|nr:AraC family transcriptional regulator [Bradyrhizobium brasilense]MCC8976391.1 helix-turn-helix transcriptional regulator [Bradyrhizobium brasilense]SDE52716.1 AraC family transcriptional regulator, ethanolamine operon transcriptional activator [Bradyrhizobium brasilense]